MSDDDLDNTDWDRRVREDLLGFLNVSGMLAQIVDGQHRLSALNRYLQAEDGEHVSHQQRGPTEDEPAQEAPHRTDKRAHDPGA